MENENKEPTGLDQTLAEIITEFSKTYKVATKTDATIHLTTNEVYDKVMDFYPGDFLKTEVFHQLKAAGYNYKPIGDNDIIFYWLFKK